MPAAAPRANDIALQYDDRNACKLGWVQENPSKPGLAAVRVNCEARVSQVRGRVVGPDVVGSRPLTFRLRPKDEIQ